MSERNLVGRIIEVDALQAQRNCNFVVLSPSWHPEDCHTLTKLSVRQEEPPKSEPSLGLPAKGSTLRVGVTAWTTMRPCSASLFVVGDAGCGRSVRIKQYLPDFFLTGHTHLALCPPTGAYVAKTEQTPGPRTAFDIADRSCGSIGIDYAGKTCATTFLHGTMVEARVTQGTFEDEDLIRMIRSLQPIESDMVRSLLDRSFAERCYWNRYQAAQHVTFLGVSSLFDGVLWNLGMGENAPSRWRSCDSHPLSSEPLPAISLPGYCLDSVGSIADSEPIEHMMLYFPDSGSRDHYVWLRHLRYVGPERLNISWPPVTGAFPCELSATSFHFGDVEAFSVHVEDCRGPHDALFATPGLPSGWFTLVQSSPCPGFNRCKFLSLVERIHSELAGLSN